MKINVDNKNTQNVQEISLRLLTALEVLQRGRRTIPVKRARAIAACANEIFSTMRIEDKKSALAGERK